MGIHSFFNESKNRFKELFSSKTVNESGDGIDTSHHRSGTNALSTIFSGAYGGIRVKSALLNDPSTGKPFDIPFWGKDFVSYPFVGITGYSDKVADEGQHGKMRGHLKDVCSALLNNKNVLSSLSKVKNPIPSDSFIFYPDTPIESVGRTGIYGKKSLSVFNPKIISVAVGTGIGPLIAEQAFEIQNGELVLSDGSKSSAIFFPSTTSAEKTKSVSNKYSAFWLDKITVNDLCNIIERSGGKDAITNVLKETLNIVMQSKSNGSEAFSDNSNTKDSFRTGASFNPTYGKFLDFISKKSGLQLQKIEEMLQQQKDKTQQSLTAWFDRWLKSNSVETICKELIIPYYFPAVFDKTYCMRMVTDELLNKNPQLKEPYEVYCRMIDGEANKFINESIEKTSEHSSSYINESTDGIEKIEIHSNNLRDKLMAVCRIRSVSKNNVFVFSTNERTMSHTRDDGNEKPHDTDIKERSFIRLLSHGYKQLPIESDKIIISQFGNDTINQLFTHGEQNYTLDYTPLFEQFSGLVDQNAKKAFSAQKICGYIITFAYNKKIEDAYYESGMESGARGLLDFYSIDSSAVKIGIPALFSLTYLPEEDFIANGYAPITDSGISKMGISTLPPCLLFVGRKHVKSVNFQYLDSFLTYGQRFNVTSTSNKNTVRTDTITKAREQIHSTR